MKAESKAIKGLIVAALLVLSFQVAAQDDDQLPGQNLTVFSEIKPVLQDAKKITFSPELPRFDSEEPELEYRFEEKVIEVEYEAPEVRPLAVKPEALEPLPHALLKVGFGNLTTPMAELYLNSGRKLKYRKGSNKSNYGAYFKYRSQKSGRAEQLYSDFRSLLFADFYTDGAYFSPYVGYSRDGNRYFGYDASTDSLLARMDNKQIYHYSYGGLKFGNSEKNDPRINVDGRLQIGYLSDYSKESEINPVFSLSGDKELDNGHRPGAEILLDYSRFAASDSNLSSQLLFSFHPFYRLGGDGWMADLGLRTGSDDHGFFILPALCFEKELVDELLIFRADIQGESRNNTFKALTDENPFLNTGQQLTSSRILDLSAGIAGVPFANFSYSVKAGYRLHGYMPFYLNDTARPNRFNVIFDTATSVVNFHAEAGYDVNKKVHFLASADFYKYTPSEQFKAWHRPAMKFALGLRYQITPALYAGTQVNVLGKMWARDESLTAIQLPGLVDINLEAGYKINDSFHIFAHVNNLASVKYQRWYRYPGYGINGLAGIQMVF